MIRFNGNTFHLLTALIAVFLTVLFIALKLCAIIAWSWVLVLLPILIYCGIWILLIVAVTVFIFFATRY